MSGPHSSNVSRALHGVDAATSKAWLAALLSLASVAALVVTVVVGTVTGVTVLAAVVQVITLVMVFVVQHTQAREQRIMQRKLDEVLGALPGADDRVIMLEAQPDDHIDETARRHRAETPQW